MATTATPTQSHSTSKRITLDDVRRDWRVLEEPAFEPPAGVRLISHEQFTSVPELPVEYVPPGRLSRWLRFLPWLAQFLYAVRLLRRCKKNTVLILNGSGVLCLLTGLLNRFLFRGISSLRWIRPGNAVSYGPPCAG